MGLAIWQANLNSLPSMPSLYLYFIITYYVDAVLTFTEYQMSEPTPSVSWLISSIPLGIDIARVRLCPPQSGVFSNPSPLRSCPSFPVFPHLSLPVPNPPRSFMTFTCRSPPDHWDNSELLLNPKYSCRIFDVRWEVGWMRHKIWYKLRLKCYALTGIIWGQ